MTTCPWCGRRATPNRTCGCGHMVPNPPTLSSSPVRLLPAGAFALIALLALFWAFSGLSTPYGNGLLSLLTVLFALVVPVVLALVALGLARGKRVARAGAGLVATLLGVLALTSTSPAIPVVDFLVAAATVVALVLVPDLRAHVAEDRPSIAPSVQLVRTIVTLLAASSAFLTVLSLFFTMASLVGMSALSATSSSGGTRIGPALVGFAATTTVSFALVGLVVQGGLAAFGFWVRGALVRRNMVARILLTVVSGLATALLLVLAVAMTSVPSGGATAAPATAAALHVALLVLLWVPSDTRVYFGGHPIAAVEDLRRQLVAATSGSGRSRPSPAQRSGHPWPSRAPSSPPVAWPAPSAGRPPTSPVGSQRRPSGSWPHPTSGSSNWPSAADWPTAAPTTPARASAPPASDDATTSLKATSPTPTGRSEVPSRISSKSVCGACARPSERGWSHCPHCGTRLATVEPEPLG